MFYAGLLGLGSGLGKERSHCCLGGWAYDPQNHGVAFADQIGPETNKYVCAPCSNCKGQIRDLIGYYEAWDRCKLHYGGLVELVVNALKGVREGFLDWDEIDLMR